MCVTGCVLVAAAAICGCGRVGFDPLGDGGASSDALDTGSDAAGTQDGTSQPDANPAACAGAIDVVTNTPKRSTTCLGFDRVDGCGPVGAEEVVFRWVVPSTGIYQISSTEVGTNIIRSTGMVDDACSGTSSCIGLLQTNFTAGEVFYFVVEGQGGCMTYDFLVSSS